MGKLVSVIMPTYKRPYVVLARAVKSVLGQTHSELELIIIDDSPKEDPNRTEVEFEIKKNEDVRVKYIQHEYNQGACKARNTGIEKAKGEFIAFLDDDDEWLPNKLELQLKKFKDPEVGLVYCHSFTIVLEDNIEVDKKIRSKSRAGWVSDSLIVENFIGSTSFVLLRKQVLDDCGFFNVEIRSAQDYELWMRISKKYKVDFVGAPLVNYYVHSGERISTNVSNKIQGLESFNELNIECLKMYPKVLSIRKLKIIPYYAVRDGGKVAFLKWIEAVKIYPWHINAFKSIVKLILILLKRKFVILFQK